MKSLDCSTAVPVSHVLLIEEDTPDQVREMILNTCIVSDCYRRLLRQNENRLMESKYKVILAVSKDSPLAACCDDANAELQRVGINSYVAKINSEEMLLCKGKAGLLFCVNWLISGTVILNENPIPVDKAEKTLLLANQLGYTRHHLILFKQSLFQADHKIGLVRSASSVGHLLRGALSSLQASHRVSDILKLMKANCSKEELLVAS